MSSRTPIRSTQAFCLSKLTRRTHETLVDGTIARENYGIALPIGSALRKKTNETLLDITADGTYDELYSKYFEDVHSG